MTLSTEQLKKAQSLLQKILDEVNRICEDNNIKYFLHYGTLIGAIRHNGFIPWDDDIDICMSRENYNKFCLVAKEKLQEEFILQNEDTDEFFGGCYSKVILKNTKWIENNARDTKRKFVGLFIDIFPLDAIPENEKLQKKQMLAYKIINMLICAKLDYSASAYKEKNRFLYKISKIISVFFSLKYLKTKRRLLILKYSKTDSPLVTSIAFYECSITRKEYIENLTKHIFEGKQYYIPIEYDRMLKSIYGNYMSLPPIEKRVNHSIVEFDFGPY